MDKGPKCRGESQGFEIGSSGPLAEAGYRDSAKSRDTRILLSSICGTKTRWEMETGDRSQSLKSLHSGSSFQDGDSQICASIDQDQRVCHINRSVRRISAHPHAQSVTEIPALCNRQGGIRVQSSPVRTEPISVDFHQSNGVGNGISQTKNSVRRFQLFRRRSTKEFESSTVGNRLSCTSSVPERVRLESQSPEVRTHTDSTFCAFRNVLPNRSEFSDTHGKESFQNSDSRSLHTETDIFIPASNQSTDRHGSVGNGFNSTRSSFTTSPSVVISRSVGSGITTMGHVDRADSTVSRRNSGMDQSRVVITGGSTSASSTRDYALYRRINNRLGSSSPSRISNSARVLDSSRDYAPHQCTRVISSREGSPTLDSVFAGATHPDSVRQCNSVCVSEESGGNEVQAVVYDSGQSSKLLSCKSHNSLMQTHSREIECHRGRFVEENTISNRMDSVGGSVRKDFEQVSRNGNRLVRDKVQQQTSAVCVSVSRQHSSSLGRPEFRLDTQRSVCISSLDAGSLGPKEAGSTSVQDDFNCSFEMESILDIGAIETSSATPSCTATTSRPAVSARITSSSSGSGINESSCMATIRRTLRDRGFSDSVIDRILADKRASTLKVYDAKWNIFANYCKSLKLDPFTLSAPKLCDFFVWLFSVHGLKPITIRGYASALARVFNLCQLPDPTKNMAVKALLKNFDLERPRSVNIFPKWNINIVLNYLQEDKFNNLELIDNADLSHKTVFLIALATAFRVSEIHAFSRSEECLRWNDDGSVTLATHAGFIAKNKRPAKAGQKVTIKPLLENDKLCPVRFLRHYLQVTRESSSSQLFVPLQSTTSRTTPQLLSAWMTRLIRVAHKEAAAQLPETAGILNLESDQ